MKARHLLLAISITAIWGVNFSVIKLGLTTVDPLILAGIRFTLCALPAIFFIPKPDVQWRYIMGYGLVFGIGLWSVVNLGIQSGLSAGIAFLVWSSAFSPLPLFALDYAVNGSTGYSALVNQLDYRAVLSILFQVYPNTLFGYWVWNSLLKRYPVSTVAPLSLLVPVFGLLGSVTIFNESLSVNKIVAVVLIVSGLGVGLYGQRVFSAVLKRPDRCPS